MLYCINNLSSNLIISNSVLIYNNDTNIGLYQYKTQLSKIINCGISSEKNAKYYFKTRYLKSFLISLSHFLRSLNVGYSIELLLVGLGFKVMRSKKLHRLFFELHFSHRLIFQIPHDIAAKCDKKKILLFGLQKSRVIDTAEELRNLRIPNIYKGKGIRYLNEVIRLKPGKQR